MLNSDEIVLYGTVSDSIVDGPGLRYGVFVQGCSHDCPGCHNPKSHDYFGGTVYTLDDLISDIEKKQSESRCVTISGGEPFDQVMAVAELVKRLKEKDYNVWVYTGYLYEDLINRHEVETNEILELADVLVDGPFIKEQKSLALTYKGSKNQRVIELQKTKERGRVIIWNERDSVLESLLHQISHLK